MADDVNVNTGTAAGTRSYEELLVSGYKFLTRNRTIESGSTVSRGEVLAKKTSSGKLVPYYESASDGVGTAFAIAAEDIDASAADKIGAVYTMGVFNKNALVIEDTGVTADNESMYDDLRERGLHLADSVPN